MPRKKAPYGYTKSGRPKKKPGRKKGQTKKYGPVYDPSKAGKKRRGRKAGRVIHFKIRCGTEGQPILEKVS